MKKNDRGDGCRCTISLQKCTALEYQNKIGIPYYTPGILDHIPLYEKSLQVGITVISAQSGNKRVYKGNSSYKLQVTLYYISDEDTSHFAVITHINSLISRAYYCEDCNKGFNNRNYHRCTVWYNICGRNGQCEENKDEKVQDNNGDNFYNSCNCIFCSRSIIYGEQQGRNIGTEPVTIQCGEGLPPIYRDEQEEEEEEEEVLVGDDDLIP